MPPSVSVIFLLALLAKLVLGIDLVELEARHYHPSHDPVPRLGAVASESAVCSRIGTNLLEQGGNAADAVGIRARDL